MQFFISDIRLLYFNKSVELEKKYSMPATQSMFVVDRILKKLAISLASQKMTTQENLTKKIRSEVLVPAYNLRNAPPISETSGITYLALGTFSLLLIATLWDLANLLFFRTITDHSFLRKISGAERREKRAAAKQKAALKKKVAKKPADPKKAAESQTKSAPKPGKPKSAPTKSTKKVADSNNAVKKPRPTADKQVEGQKKIAPARKTAAASPKKTAPATNGKPPKKTVNKAVAQKRTSPEASQKPNKKVTNPAEKNKSAVKAAPAKPKAKTEAPTKAPAPKAVKVKE
ncbi:hypothetical protein [Maridesulfovibrio ferrireducens]|uniref:hypothetical protein n=1 Tax=Maridesulfovibrio ferrireducens TaxID=246191 RepID=UPI00111333D3|nr:hypothetical protein [Maridesulfovibrio ferrireducens]